MFMSVPEDPANSCSKTSGAGSPGFWSLWPPFPRQRRPSITIFMPNKATPPHALSHVRSEVLRDRHIRVKSPLSGEKKEDNISATERLPSGDRGTSVGRLTPRCVRPETTSGGNGSNGSRRVSDPVYFLPMGASQWPVRDAHGCARHKRPVSVRTKCRLEWIERILIPRLAAAYGASLVPALVVHHSQASASPSPASLLSCERQ
ncbi:hypothetical protein FOFC_07300 [Fusarium oxysporum]|nr:hypothetical protein FOFC_07300 [Fusarium oxysporum]